MSRVELKIIERDGISRALCVSKARIRAYARKNSPDLEVKVSKLKLRSVERYLHENMRTYNPDMPHVINMSGVGQECIIDFLQSQLRLATQKLIRTARKFQPLFVIARTVTKGTKLPTIKKIVDEMGEAFKDYEEGGIAVCAVGKQVIEYESYNLLRLRTELDVNR